MSKDDYRKASMFPAGSFDVDFPVPDLIGATEILTEEHRFVILLNVNLSSNGKIYEFIKITNLVFLINREKICGHLPARAEGYSWSLIFSTSQHGFSLNSLYRKMQRLESPVLVVIQDTEHNVSLINRRTKIFVKKKVTEKFENELIKFKALNSTKTTSLLALHCWTKLQLTSTIYVDKP